VKRLIPLFVLLSLYSSVRSAAPDSLIRIYNSSKDTQKINTCNRIAFHYLFEDPEKALRYCYDGIKLAVDLKYSYGEACARNNTGLYYYIKGSYKEALDNFFQSLRILEELKSKKTYDLSALNISLGNVYARIGSLYYDKAGLTNNSDDYGNSINYYRQSLKVVKESNDSAGIAYAYHNLGLSLEHQGKFSQALEYYILALGIKERLDDVSGMSNTFNNMANVFEAQGELKKAMEYQLKAINILGTEASDYDVAVSEINIGSLYMQMGDNQSALLHLKEGVRLSEKYGSRDLMFESYSRIAEAYKKTGNYEKALFYYQKFSDQKDSLINKENSDITEELQVRYQSEKKDKEILLLNKNKEISDIKNTKLEWFRNSLIIGVVLVLIVAFLLYNRSRIKTRANVKLAAYNTEILDQKSEIEQQKRIVEQKNKEITDSINYARRIQLAILPPEHVITTLFPESFVYFSPKDIVSGDFYWVERWGGKKLIAVADCTGHGVPGAFMTFVGNSVLNEVLNVHGIDKPAAMLNQLRKGMNRMFHDKHSQGQMRDGMDIALCAIDEQTLQLEFAGVNNPLWIVRDGEVIELKADKIDIADHELSAERAHFSTQKFDLKSGDKIYLFSDGLPDQFGGPKGKKFKYKQFQELILGTSKMKME
jgi:serine phosphatase RsbU (regulator of sigma subunit)